MKSKSELNREYYSSHFNKYVLEVYKKEYIVIGDYLGSAKPILMFHTLCKNTFNTTPNRFKDLHKLCPHCNGNMALNNKAKQKFHDFMLKERKDYKLLSEYLTTMQPIKVKHMICGTEYITTPNNINSKGHGCPHCASKYSKISINWLNTLAYMLDININHYENGGEFIIPGTKYRADGYCKELNLIFEFHGDLFHGGVSKGIIMDNPKTREHGELCFEKTVKRMKHIENLGYSIFYVFESDWNLGHIGDFFGKHPWANN